MTIQGLGQGWKAGIQDTSLGASIGQAARSGDIRSAGEVMGNAAGRAGTAIQGAFQQLGVAVVRGTAGFLGAVGANEMAREARQVGHELQAARHEGRAESSLQKAGSHFKRAFTAAPRAHGDAELKGIGANLAFSVASWGANMKEGMKSLGCAIADGFRSMASRFKAQS